MVLWELIALSVVIFVLGVIISLIFPPLAIVMFPIFALAALGVFMLGLLWSVIIAIAKGWVALLFMIASVGIAAYMIFKTFEQWQKRPMTSTELGLSLGIALLFAVFAPIMFSSITTGMLGAIAQPAAITTPLAAAGVEAPVAQASQFSFSYAIQSSFWALLLLLIGGAFIFVKPETIKEEILKIREKLEV